jgi:hypothetical protein
MTGKPHDKGNRPSIMKKYLANTMMAIIMGSFFGSSAVQYDYTRHRPERAQPELSRTVALPVFYNKTVFVTERDKWILHSIYIVGAVGAVVLVLLIYSGVKL